MKKQIQELVKELKEYNKQLYLEINVCERLNHEFQLKLIEHKIENNNFTISKLESILDPSKPL